MSCKCQKCGRRFRVDIIVRNDLWERIKPKGKPPGAGLLCGRCIIDAVLREFGREYGAMRLVAVAGLNGQPYLKRRKKTIDKNRAYTMRGLSQWIGRNAASFPVDGARTA